MPEQPTSEEIIRKARIAGFIDSETAEELMAEDINDVLGAVYGYIQLQGRDPDQVFKRWGIT